MVIVYYVAAFLFMSDACMEFFGGGKVGNGVVWLLLCIVFRHCHIRLPPRKGFPELLSGNRW